MQIDKNDALTAGIMLGDGSIGISKRRDSRPGRRCYFRLWISVHNTEKVFLTWLKRNYRGSICAYKSRRNKTRFKGRKQVYAWAPKPSDYKQFLVAILPYLMGNKLKRAKLMLEFLAAGTSKAPPDAVYTKRRRKQVLLWRKCRAIG